MRDRRDHSPNLLNLLIPVSCSVLSHKPSYNPELVGTELGRKYSVTQWADPLMA